jgi:hypothetical protein
MPERGAWAHSGHILGTFWAQTISQFCKLLNMNEFSFGAGRGANPHDRKGRRILSLFFAILQRVASDRKLSHKPCGLRMLQVRLFLQSAAAKCTKVGNEQPSKRPLKSAPKARQIDQKHGGLKVLSRTSTDRERPTRGVKTRADKSPPEVPDGRAFSGSSLWFEYDELKIQSKHA